MGGRVGGARIRLGKVMWISPIGNGLRLRRSIRIVRGGGKWGMCCDGVAIYRILKIRWGNLNICYVGRETVTFSRFNKYLFLLTSIEHCLIFLSNVLFPSPYSVIRSLRIPKYFILWTNTQSSRSS